MENHQPSSTNAILEDDESLVSKQSFEDFLESSSDDESLDKHEIRSSYRCNIAVGTIATVNYIAIVTRPQGLATSAIDFIKASKALPVMSEIPQARFHLNT